MNSYSSTDVNIVCYFDSSIDFRYCEYFSVTRSVTKKGNQYKGHKTQTKVVKPRSSLNEVQPEPSTSNQTNVDQQLLKRKLPSDFLKAMGIITPKKRPTRVETTPFTIKEVSKSTYSDGISDTTFEVKLSNDYFGLPLSDILVGLHRMFDQVISETKSGFLQSDLGQVVINHDGLDNPIVVPLRKLKLLTGKSIMEKVSNVLNSEQHLSLDASFNISIGLIKLVVGKSRYNIHTNADKKKKKSIVTIYNDDNICLQRAIAVGWSKAVMISEVEFAKLQESETNDFSKGKARKLNVVMKYMKTSPSFCREVSKQYVYKRGKKMVSSLQRKLTQEICDLVGISYEQPATLADLVQFESVLKINICIVSRQKGNKCIIGQVNDNKNKVFLYLDNDHFDVIHNITGFFNKAFCNSCLVPFNRTTGHSCESYCSVCVDSNCQYDASSAHQCLDCHYYCQSMDCYQRHKQKNYVIVAIDVVIVGLELI